MTNELSVPWLLVMVSGGITWVNAMLNNHHKRNLDRREAIISKREKRDQEIDDRLDKHERNFARLEGPAKHILHVELSLEERRRD